MTWTRQSALRAGGRAGLVAFNLSQSFRLWPLHVGLDSGHSASAATRIVAGHCHCSSGAEPVCPLPRVVSSGRRRAGDLITCISEGGGGHASWQWKAAAVLPLNEVEAAREWGRRSVVREEEDIPAKPGSKASARGSPPPDWQRKGKEGTTEKEKPPAWREVFFWEPRAATGGGKKGVLEGKGCWLSSLAGDGVGAAAGWPPSLAQGLKAQQPWILTKTRSIVVRARGYRGDKQGHGNEHNGQEVEGKEKGKRNSMQREGSAATAAGAVAEVLESSPPSSDVGGGGGGGGGGKGAAAASGPVSPPSPATAASPGNNPPVSADPKNDSTVANVYTIGGNAGGDESNPVVLEAADDLWSGVMEVIQSIRVLIELQFYRQKTERNFDLMDFLEGVRHAYFTVNDLFAKSDFETLKEMVAPQIARSFEETAAYYKKEGLRMDLRIDSVDHVRLVKVALLSNAAEILELNGMAPVIDGYTNDKWLVFEAKLRSQDRCRLFDQGTGRLVSHTIDKRGHTWFFARQLPDDNRLPVDELESPWYLVDFRFN